MSWNGFPKRVRRSIVNRLKNNMNIPKQIKYNNVRTIWLKLPFVGRTGEVLANKCIKKLNRLLGKKVKFIIRYDRPPNFRSWNSRKTDRFLAFRLREHATRPEQPWHHHFVD